MRRNPPCLNKKTQNVGRGQSRIPRMNVCRRDSPTIFSNLFRGQQRQYAPSEFGLSPNEQFQDANVLQNVDFDTDCAAFEQLRGPARPAYQPRRAPTPFSPGLRGQQRQYAPSEFGLSPNEQFQDANVLGNVDFNTDCAAFEQLQGPVRPAYQQRSAPTPFSPGLGGQQRQYAPSEFGLSPNEQFQDANVLGNVDFNTDCAAFEQLQGPVRPAYQQRSAPTPFSPGPQGQQRQYSPSEFGLSPNEQFQDANMLGNVDFNTDCAAFEQLQGPVRPAYQQGSAPTPFSPGPQGQQRQYSPSEFGLSPNEQFQDAQMFRNLDFNTDCAAFEQLRGPARPAYQPRRSPAPFSPRFQGQQGQYSPSEFGLSPNEQFQDAQMFRNLDFNTDRAAFEQLRGPGRPAYQVRAPRLSGLPDECLEDMSLPSQNISARSEASRQSSQQMGNECIDDVSSPSMLKDLSSGVISCLDEISAQAMGDDFCEPDQQSAMPDECIDDISAPAPPCEQTGSDMDSLYTNVLARFEELKKRLAAESAERAKQNAAAEADCIAGAEKTTTTQIDTSGGDVVKEIVLQNSKIENGEIHKTTRHIITRRDSCGNEKSECNECKEVSPAPPQGMQLAVAGQGISPHHDAIACGDPCLQRLFGNVRKRLDFDLSGDITQEPCPPCEDELGDESAPLFAESLSSSPRKLSFPSEQLGEMSQYSFASSLPSSISPDCLEDVSAPSLEMGSPISPLTRFQRMPSPASQRLSDMSAPSFERSVSSPVQGECVDNVSAPSLRRSTSMRSSPRAPSQQVCDISAQRSMPSLAASPQRRMPSPAPSPQRSMPMRSSPRAPSPQTPMRSSPQRYSQPSEEICDMPQPFSYASTSPPSFHDSFLPPCQPECLDDVSAPSLGRSMSMRSSPRMRSLPSDQICEMGSPSFGSSLPSSVGPDCLEDVSAPSLEMGSPISPLTRFQRMPSPAGQRLSDMSAPSFARSVSSPCPSPQRSMSMRSSPRVASMPGQQICDVSPQRPMPSPGPSPQRRMPSPAQSPQRSMPMRSSPRAPSPQTPMRSSPQRYSQPSEEICEMPQTFSYASTSPPSFHDSFLPPCQPECLDDVSAPSLGRSMSMRSSPRMRSLPSDQICEMGSPSFGSSLPSSVGPDCLEDVSAPSLEMGSPISPLTRFQRMPSPAGQRLSDMSAPSFARSVSSPCPSPQRSMSMRSSPRVASMPGQQICDVSPQRPMPSPGPSPQRRMPSPAQSPQRSMPMRSSPRAPSPQTPMRSSPQRYSQPSEEICDMPQTFSYASTSPPSFHDSFLPPCQPECLDDVSAPSLGRSMSMRSSPRMRSLPSDQICDMGSPSFGSSLPSSIGPDCLEDVSAPSLEMGSPISPLTRFQRMPSPAGQRLSDMSAPSFARSVSSPCPSPQRSMSMRSSPRVASMPGQQICDVTPQRAMPSPAPSPQRRMPSPAQSPQRSMPMRSSPRAPSPQTPMRSSPQRRSQPSEQICDVPQPSPYQSPTPPSFHDSYLPSYQPECLDDESAPSLGKSMSMRSSPRMRSMPSDKICDMPSPSFGSSLLSSDGGEFLADISAPPLAMGTPISPLTRFQRMPSPAGQHLSDMSAPSFARSMQSAAPEECVAPASPVAHNVPQPSPASPERSGRSQQPSFNRPMSAPGSPFFQGPSNVNEECLFDETPPPMNENSYIEKIEVSASMHSIATRMIQDNRNISQISQPSYGTIESSQSPSNQGGVSSIQSSQSPANQSPFRGFDTMPNYMPFEEQIRRTPQEQRNGCR